MTDQFLISQMLYNKWWRKDDSGNINSCPKESSDPSKASALNVVNIGGVFVVLLCGLSFAIIVAIGEFCWKTWGENEAHPATVKLPSSSSIRGKLFNTLRQVFYGQRVSGGGKRGVSECYSCQNLRSEGYGIKYI